MPAIQNGHIQKQNSLDANLSVEDLDALDQYILTSPLAFVGQLVYVETIERYYSITVLEAGGYTPVTQSAGGDPGQVQFNQGGMLAGSPDLTWDGTALSLGGDGSGEGYPDGSVGGGRVHATRAPSDPDADWPAFAASFYNIRQPSDLAVNVESVRINASLASGNTTENVWASTLEAMPQPGSVADEAVAVRGVVQNRGDVDSMYATRLEARNRGFNPNFYDEPYDPEAVHSRKIVGVGFEYMGATAGAPSPDVFRLLEMSGEDVYGIQNGPEAHAIYDTTGLGWHTNSDATFDDAALYFEGPSGEQYVFGFTENGFEMPSIGYSINETLKDSYLLFTSDRNSLSVIDGKVVADDGTREYVSSATYSERAALTIGSRSGEEGLGSIVLGIGTVDEANQLTASEASGVAAAAIGVANTASGFASMAEGWETTAELFGSHAEGHETTSTGWGAHAEGKLTQAQGFAAHAEGLETTAEGSHSHAGGEGSHAIADGSRAAGINVIASAKGGMAVGLYNVDYSGTQTKPIFQVGVGEEGTREDAILVEADGTVTISSLDVTLDPGQVTPPGSDRDLIFNDAGTLGASSAASVNDDGIQLEKDGGGIVFRSEDGTKYKLTIANDGTPNVTAITETQ